MATPAARSPFVLAQLLEGFPPFLYLNPLALNPTWKMLSHSGRPRKIRSYFPQHILAIWHSFRGGKTTNLLSEQIQLRTHQFLIRSPYQIPFLLTLFLSIPTFCCLVRAPVRFSRVPHSWKNALN